MILYPIIFILWLRVPGRRAAGAVIGPVLVESQDRGPISAALKIAVLGVITDIGLTVGNRVRAVPAEGGLTSSINVACTMIHIQLTWGDSPPPSPHHLGTVSVQPLCNL